MTTAIGMLQNNGLASPEGKNAAMGNGLKAGEKVSSAGLSKELNKQSQQKLLDAASKAPKLPHVEVNQLPLALLIRNLTVFSIKELVQFLKTSVHEGQDATVKKTAFLQLVVYLRNQFLKIYVLVKWCRTIRNNNFNSMIDLLNWFRGSNMVVNNCIWALKASLAGMTNAKLPNPDLITALEVLSLGRPNLPTHNFTLSGDEDSHNGSKTSVVPSKLILKKLRDMNIIMSVKVSVMELPEQFKQYSVRDGRLSIRVDNEFEIQLSTTDQRSPLFFVDLKLLFNEFLPLNKYKLEKVINEVLYKSPRPLFALYRLLHNHVLSVQMYMIHAELLDLESNSKYSGGNLVHHYDSRKNIINLKYWLQSRLKGKCNATIGVEGKTGSIILKWNVEGIVENQPDVPVPYTNVLTNLGNILDEIMFNHSQMIKTELLSTGVLQEDEDISDALLFNVPSTPASVIPIQLKINLISGVFYVRNPSGLLTFYINQINKTTTTDDFIKVLSRLKLDKIISILRNMFEKVGWVCKNVVKLSGPVSKDPSRAQEKILSRDLFIRLNSWPANWYLILSVISSNTACVIEKRIGKITASKGNWELRYLDTENVATLKLESMTYQKIIHLKKTSLHTIVDHMIIDSLNELHIRNKICAGNNLNAVPDYILRDGQSHHLSVLSIELESFLGGSCALNHILEKTMFLRIDYQDSKIKLFGKFKHNSKVIGYQYNDMLMEFTDKGALSFFMSEIFTDLNNIVQHFSAFKQKLMQIVTLTDVIERLHDFYSENFSIVALKPNEISFKYLKNSNDDYDCRIHILTSDHSVENLDVKLSPSNPQYIIQPFIESSKQDYHFVFNYLQFTSGFFGVLGSILTSPGNNVKATNGYTTVSLQLHNLSEYELIYYNPETNTKITLMIELRNVFLNGVKKLRYFVHFADDEHISTKSPAYPLVHQVRNTVFMIDSATLVTSDTISGLGSPKKPKASSVIRLTEGLCCDAADIELVIKDINDILKIDCI
ncbi:LANO_0D10638g1_1 [Lachancea nothofagi CBS 11611]|uniref:Mediator of RNA polymerase II transcription subunit 14 n=1 Tax=Lachancea nothofagi CBS 11611 TaxID=1266666 RepID=A0A1G4JKR2_9SACH|nr:LANO_0D10638g1_1 [Lachancea nothofagi CBS 11611]